MKFVLLAGLIVLALMWLQRPKGKDLPGGASGQRRLASEAMLACTDCGLHAPASEMLFDAARRAYCCEEHRRRHAAR
jgi:uncharacterized protein